MQGSIIIEQRNEILEISKRLSKLHLMISFDVYNEYFQYKNKRNNDHDDNLDITQIASNLKSQSSHPIINNEFDMKQTSNNQGNQQKSIEKPNYELNLVSGFQIQIEASKFPSNFISKRFMMKIVKMKLIIY
jgi:hypothetical protein